MTAEVYSPGLEGIIAGETAISTVEGGLRYRGYPVTELAEMPCIGADRAELALAGGAILEAVCRQWQAPMVRVADRGLREGVLMDLMRQADREADPFFCRLGDC